MVALSGRDTWIATFFSSLAGLLWTVFLVMKTGPDQFKENLARPAGKLVGLVLAVYLIEVAVLMIYDFINFFATILLKTPAVIYSVVLVALCAYAILKGFETVANVSIVLMFFSGILIGVSLIGGLSQVDPARLLPLLDHGPKPVVYGALFQFSSFGHLLVLYCFPINPCTPSAKRATALALAIVYAVIAALSTALIGVFGVEESSRIIYKFFDLFRELTVGGFFRIETLFIPVWFSTFLVKVTVLYYAMIKILQLSLGVKTSRFLVLPVGVILVALTHFSFTSYAEYIGFYVRTFTWVSITVMVVIPLCLLLARGKALHKRA